MFTIEQSACYLRRMKFRDTALDEQGERREGYDVGARFMSDCGRWQVVASDVKFPAIAEWQVWQHVEPTLALVDPRAWRRRLAWVRLPQPEHAQAVAEVLASLPATASWVVARAALRDALRAAGAVMFFRGMSAASSAAGLVASGLRARQQRSGGDAE